VTLRDDDSWFEEQDIRRRVRERLQLMRDIATFVVVTGVLAILDGATGGGWWVQWLAIIWGAVLALRIIGPFGNRLWGRDVEDRMVARELERRRRPGA
jgi:fatty acid desaturase